MNRLSLLLVFVTLAFGIAAQSPSPGTLPEGPIALVGGTAHIGNGTVVDNALLVMTKGVLTYVGSFDASKIPANATQIKTTGKQIYPGWIATNTRLGLVDIEAVKATVDYRELGDFTPNIRSLTAYNAESAVIPTIRSNGVLTAQVMPAGGTMPGSSSVMQLDAWNWEDAVLSTDFAQHLHWPGRFDFTGWGEQGGEIKKNANYDDQVQVIKTFFQEAKAYVSGPAPAVTNLKFESMRALFAGKSKLFVHTNEATAIQHAVLFAKEFGITPVICGGYDSWMLTDFLKQHQVPVILGGVNRLPTEEDEDVDQPYKTPRMLHDAGVLFTISIDGAWQQRNLPFQAGTAAAFGLPRESAVAMISGNAARILGLHQQLGTLEQGKSATLFISAGDALDMRTATVEMAWIQGKPVDLDNKQKQLYRKYKAKYDAAKG